MSQFVVVVKKLQVINQEMINPSFILVTKPAAWPWPVASLGLKKVGMESHFWKILPRKLQGIVARSQNWLEGAKYFLNCTVTKHRSVQESSEQPYDLFGEMPSGFRNRYFPGTHYSRFINSQMNCIALTLL